ncbi:MAG: xanthine dehydrogenase family protein subunit M [Dehalococcoidia bacterium]|nr:xanthine dehydrogenase family protein subunit M [Dehalococcoidia bacterium]
MRELDYLAPTSIAEAVQVLGERGEGARVLSGGTDIIVQAREGRRNVEALVDVKDIPETRALRFEADGSLTIGAAAPCAEIYENADIVRSYPGLIDAASLIGGIQIQSRASLGGNLCNSSPAADSIPALIALVATCRIAGPEGERTIPVEEFCTGPGANQLARGEMLVSIHLPAPAPNSGAAFQRFIPRNEMDIAVCNCGASLVLSADGQSIESARVALGAVAPTPLLVEGAAAALVGNAPDDAALDRAAEAAAAAARPITDMRGSVAQRRHLAAVLTRRVLRVALERARGS